MSKQCYDILVIGEPTKTAHRQNGPNEGLKRLTKTKTAPMEEKTTKMAPADIQNGPFSCPKRPIT